MSPAAARRLPAPSVGPIEAALAWHAASPGKGLRRRLAAEAGRALGIAPDLAQTIAGIVEDVHEASILIDDVNDRTPMRRGRKSVYARFGSDRANLAGLSLLCAAQARAAALAGREPTPGAMAAALAEAVAAAADGQARALAGPAACWAEYDAVARGKTGRLVALAVELPALAAGLAPDAVARLREAAELVGLAYQIADDVADGDVAFVGFSPTPDERLVALKAAVARAVNAAPLALRGPLARLTRAFAAGSAEPPTGARASGETA